MLYYAQKLTGGAGRALESDLGVTAAIFHTEAADDPASLGPSVSVTQPTTDTEEGEEDGTTYFVRHISGCS